MKIVIDDKIPYIKGELESLGCEVIYINGEDISCKDIVNAECLITRTRTTCNSSLLEGSSIKLIATATIGTDHIDLKYCKRKGIEVITAAGCSSFGVLQYIMSALSYYFFKEGGGFKGAKLGVVGVGTSGSLVSFIAKNLGMRVFHVDPYKDNVNSIISEKLEDVVRKVDILTFHTPLVRDGEFPTEDILRKINLEELHNIKLIINSSRGEVVSNDTYYRFLALSKSPKLVIDVWENEPNIDRELVKQAMLSTAHIAGYSKEGKLNATKMVVKGVVNFFSLNNIKEIVINRDFKQFYPVKDIDKTFDYISLFMEDYDIENDSFLLKESLEFERLRNEYNYRD